MRLKEYLEAKNVHPDDIEEILEGEREDMIEYIRHDLYLVYQDYIKEHGE